MIKTDIGSRPEKTAVIVLALAGGVTAFWLMTGAASSSTLTPTPGCTDAWIATSVAIAPSARIFYTAVWTGSEMIVWGGYGNGGPLLHTGGKYNPSTDSWVATSITNAPTPRQAHTAIWTGSEMIVWGGGDDYGSAFNTGGRYNPSTDIWTPITTTNAPTGRYAHKAVWTGSEMIVWGGADIDGAVDTGGKYNPSTDIWTPITNTNAPTARSAHTAIWTGSEMIVWGGVAVGSAFINTGGKYNPSTDSWTATSTTSAPTLRDNHTAVWTGNEMIVWGGNFFDGNNSYFLNTGGRYLPGTDSWTATSITNVPDGRFNHTAVWTGSEMIVWGGYFYDGSPNFSNTGGKYDPGADSWTLTSTTNAPTGRFLHTAVWTGSEMIVWGGRYDLYWSITGGRYCAQPTPAPTPTPTQTPTPVPTITPTPSPTATATPNGGNGSFVIGDLDAVVGRTIYFWGSQWAEHNHLSQGSPPSAFRGFANSIGGTIPNCGDVWQSDPGNSSGPPSSVPSFINVIASSSIGMSGPVISGNDRKVVVVRTDLGYRPSPGHAGTGVVISITCE